MFLGHFPLASKYGRSVKFILVALPILASFFICVTRISDYKHHWEDVVIGFLLGATFALLAYRLYFHFPWALNSTALYDFDLSTANIIKNITLDSPLKNSFSSNSFAPFQSSKLDHFSP